MPTQKNAQCLSVRAFRKLVSSFCSPHFPERRWRGVQRMSGFSPGRAGPPPCTSLSPGSLAVPRRVRRTAPVWFLVLQHRSRGFEHHFCQMVNLSPAAAAHHTQQARWDPITSCKGESPGSKDVAVPRGGAPVVSWAASCACPMVGGHGTYSVFNSHVLPSDVSCSPMSSGAVDFPLVFSYYYY